MTLHVYTARITYRGPDALDITRGTADKARKAGLPRPPGEFLAPSAGLVFPTLRKLKAARTDEEREAVWLGYETAFFAEMEHSWATRRAEWDALFAQERVCLLCFCVDPNRCHRTLVADMLAKRGAINHSELTDPRPPCVICDPDGGGCDCGFRPRDSGPPGQLSLVPSLTTCYKDSAAPSPARARTLLLPKGGE